MYIPRHNRMADEDQIFAFLHRYNFGALVTSCQGQLAVNHLPFVVDRPQRRLYAHLARANAHWQTLEAADDLLVVFAGPHAYISPTWYATEGLVPTWNFSAVHVRGRAALTDEAGARDIVEELTQQHEAGTPAPWSMDRVPAERLEGLLKAIVGFSVEIHSIEAKAKLSQEKSAADRQGALAGLDAGGPLAQLVAADMRQVNGD